MDEISSEEKAKLLKELIEIYESDEDRSKEERTKLRAAIVALSSGQGKVMGKKEVHIGSSGKDDLKTALSGSSRKEQSLSSGARAIHTSNMMRIYKLIDKIEANTIIGDINIKDGVTFHIPEVEKWDFALGDRVIIDIPMEEFKFLQKNCMIWQRKLSNIRGKPGFVTGVSNKFHGVVEVYIPSVLTCTQIWAGTLSRTDEQFHAVPSRWKVNDYVKTRKSKELVRKFQKRLPDIPEKNIGKKGRVIAVTDVGTFVTFNEKSSYVVNPALLRSSDDSTPIKVSVKNSHPKEILVGDKVHVIRNLRKIIENQRGFGGWNWKMCSLAGKIVKVTQIKKDGSLLVALPNSRGWRINFESVCKDGAEVAGDLESDLPYLPGDKICLKLTENIKMQLVDAKVLESCIDFLKLTGEVVGIDDDFDVIVKFTQDNTRAFSPSLLRKATKQEEKHYDHIENLRRCLSKGSIVRLDAGPTRYANDILGKIDVSKNTVDAIMQPACILGYTDAEHAAIEYKDERKIRINVKYLTPIEKYEGPKHRNVDFEDIFKLMTSIKSCVAAIDFEREKEFAENGVDLYSVMSGSPPTVCFKISSFSATAELLMQRMGQVMDLKMTELGTNECTVEIRPEQEVTVVLLYFVDNPAIEKVKCLDEMIDAGDVEETIKESRESIEEAPPDNKATPFMDPPPVNPTAAPFAQPQSLDDFSYLTLQTGNGPLYIPCLNNRAVQGAQRYGRPDGNRRDKDTNNTFNIGKIENFNQYY